MRRSFTILALTCCLAYAVRSAIAEPAQPVPPTPAEIQADYDAGKYADVTRKVARVLALKGEQAKAFDRPALLALKAESHLRLKQSAVAMESFTLAAKESTDPGRASEWRALALLVKRSPGNLYSSRSGADPTTKPAGIDILAADSRKLAFAALFNEESPSVLAKAQAFPIPQAGSAEPAGSKSTNTASATKTLLDLVAQLADLRTIERLGTDADASTRPALARLAGAASPIFADLIAKGTLRVDSIQSAASNRHALGGADSSALREIIDSARKVAAASNAFASIATEDPAHAKNEKDATTLADHAEQVLKADYGGAASARPGPDNSNDDQRDRNGLPKARPAAGAGSVPGVGGVGIGGF